MFFEGKRRKRSRRLNLGTIGKKIVSASRFKVVKIFFLEPIYDNFMTVYC